jgi:hypothetical protein
VDDIFVAVTIAAASIVPLPLIFRCLQAKTALWVTALVALCCAALAVTFFLLWQWSQHPVLAYVDAIVYGLLALLAPLVAINGRLIRRDEQRRPRSLAGLGLEARPEERAESGTGSV